MAPCIYGLTPLPPTPLHRCSVKISAKLVRSQLGAWGWRLGVGRLEFGSALVVCSVDGSVLWLVGGWLAGVLACWLVSAYRLAWASDVSNPWSTCALPEFAEASQSELPKCRIFVEVDVCVAQVRGSIAIWASEVTNPC